MAELGKTYDATDGDTLDTRDVIPAGEYVAALIKADWKDAKANNGNRYLNCEFAVQDGPREGARFWVILNLKNNNSQAVDIAEREFNSILHACGKLRISDTSEIEGVPIRVTLTVKDDAQYGPQNKVKKYAPMNAAPANNSGGSTAGGGAKKRAWD